MTMPQALPLATASLLVVLTGIVPGTWSDRWGASSDLQDAVAHLDRIPLALGDWQGTKDELDPRQIAQAELAGYAVRRYEKNQRSVTTLLVCGRPGPIARHTPDVCYRGIGFEALGVPKRLHNPEPGSTEEFWVTTMRKPQAGGVTYLRVFWSWKAQGSWEAVDNPRWSYASRRALYKLYVIQELSRPDEPLEDSPAVEFIRQGLPSLNAALS